MGKLETIKDKLLYKTEDISETYEITPWKVTKTIAGLVGASVASFVVGSVLRENMPEQTKTVNFIKGVVGIYLLQGAASNAVSNYVDETLSQFDPIFEGGLLPENTETVPEQAWTVTNEDGQKVIVNG